MFEATLSLEMYGKAIEKFYRVLWIFESDFKKSSEHWMRRFVNILRQFISI